LTGTLDPRAVVRLLLPGVAVLAVGRSLSGAPSTGSSCRDVRSGWGNALHLFSEFWWYDNLVHITLPISLAPVLYIGVARLDVVAR
jgi:hypothetical protein